MIPSKGRSQFYFETIRKQIKLQKPDLIVHIPDQEKMSIEERCLSLSASNIFIERENELHEFVDCIPYNTVIRGDIKFPLVLGYRNNYLTKDGKNTFKKNRNLEVKPLPEEIAFRLIRIHELKELGSRSLDFEKQIKSLLPSWNAFPSWNKDINQTYNHLKKILTISLPSVIEALLLGIDSKFRGRGSILHEGFTQELKNSRHEILTHQLRMHPEISWYPRNLIYSAGNGKPIALNDGKINRDWGYNRYSSRVTWIDVNGHEEKKQNRGVFNQKEIDSLLEELDAFIRWAKGAGRRSEKYWEIAILTFYDKQRQKILDKLKTKFNLRGPYFVLKSEMIKIFVGNVDSMQGREADIVFLSMVRTNGIGFLDNPNRVNVAITRSRYQLVVLGKHKFFSECDDELVITKLAKKIVPEYKFQGAKGGIR